MAIFGNLENRKFRYKILSEIIFKDKELKDLLDEQGSLGWEAVHLEMERTEHLGKPCRSYRIVLKARYK